MTCSGSPLLLVKVVESELCLFSRGSCEKIKLFIVLQKEDELLIFLLLLGCFFAASAAVRERGENPSGNESEGSLRLH